MRAVVLVSIAALFASCFPENARHRTYAKIGEGAALVAGVTILAITHTGADCKTVSGTRDLECNDQASLGSTIGFGLILAGLAGFIATVSSTPDEKDPPPPLPVVQPAPGLPAPAATAPTPAATAPTPAATAPAPGAPAPAVTTPTPSLPAPPTPPSH